MSERFNFQDRCKFRHFSGCLNISIFFNLDQDVEIFFKTKEKTGSVLGTWDEVEISRFEVSSKAAPFKFSSIVRILS